MAQDTSASNFLVPDVADHLYRMTNPKAHGAGNMGSRNRNRMNSPRPRSASVAPPIFPFKDVQQLTQADRDFVDAAERGDKPRLEQLLDQGDINVNSKNTLGRTAIEIAVDNENIEMVQLLLEQPNIRIGNALMYAIREGVYKVVEMIVNHHSISPEMLGHGWGRSLDKQEALSSEFSSDISPVMLAAHLNQFEILGLLTKRGARIERPHPLSCTCDSCHAERELDSLNHSLRRIHTYRALASPAWMALNSSDPILEAFKLGWDLQNLAHRECEFKEVFLELSEQCKTFACDLLSQCRSSEEVLAVLNKDPYSDPEVEDPEGGKLSLTRVKLAIKYEQKRFIAHPHCQQLLTSIWYEGFPGRRERGSIKNIFICMILIALWPILATWYICFPRTRVGQIVRSPFMKFLYYSTSFGTFLFLLIMASFESYRHTPSSYNFRVMQRGPPPTIVESLIVFWVFGMVWAEVKQLWEEGLKKYLLQWWNWLDFMMMSLYLSTFALRTTALYLSQSGRFDEPLLARTNWAAEEPVLLSEGLFAVANILSFARIVYLFQTNPYLGPLQISLGCMLIDIVKFFFIFFLILTSFAFGLHQLYWYYTSSSPCIVDEEITVCKESSVSPFNSLSGAYVTLIWSLFSITNVKDTEVAESHEFTEWIGRGMFIAYHVTSIIVLLNMLIAMMSHSFQIINDHADLEWKFHRTKLWMSYFDEGSSLPAPFNIVLTPKSVIYAFNKLQDVFKWFFYKKQVRSPVKRATIRRPGYNKERWQRKKSPSLVQIPLELRYLEEEKATYQQIMFRLVSRYIHMSKKDMRMDGVNEDDLLEIKQDISSLRYELREDRKKEIKRSSRHIEGVKTDIIRTLSLAGTHGTQHPRVKVLGPSEQTSPAETMVVESPEASDSQRGSLSLDIPPHSPTSFFSPAAPLDGSPQRAKPRVLFHKPSTTSLPPIDASPPDSPRIHRIIRSSSPSSDHRSSGGTDIASSSTPTAANNRGTVRFQYSPKTPPKSPVHMTCECAERVEHFKTELIDVLRQEVRSLREQMSSTVQATNSRNPIANGGQLTTSARAAGFSTHVPMMDTGELYETKLYTQL